MKQTIKNIQVPKEESLDDLISQYIMSGLDVEEGFPIDAASLTIFFQKIDAIEVAFTDDDTCFSRNVGNRIIDSCLERHRRSDIQFVVLQACVKSYQEHHNNIEKRSNNSAFA